MTTEIILDNSKFFVKSNYLCKIRIPILILDFILLTGMLEKYTEHRFIWDVISVGIFIFIIVRYSFSIMRTKMAKIPIFLVILQFGLFSINVVFGESNQYLIKNVIGLILAKYVVISLFVLSNVRSDSIREWLVKRSWLLNIFWLINLYVTYQQIYIKGFLMKSWWMASNLYYKDLCAGIFGYNGTHELAFFSTFMIIYNLWISNQKERMSLKIFWYMYTFLSGFFMMYISTLNDNKVVFILFPLFILAYYYFPLNYNNIIINKKLKSIMLLGIAVLVFFGVLICVPTMVDYISTEFTRKFMSVVFFDETQIGGGNERLAIPLYALKNGFGWGFGKGIGSYEWISTEVPLFPHYGLSSIGSFIYQGGIWYYISNCLFFSLLFYRFNCPDNRIKYKSYGAFIILIIFILSVYSPIFTSMVSVVWVSLTFLIFNLSMNTQIR